MKASIGIALGLVAGLCAGLLVADRALRPEEEKLGNLIGDLYVPSFSGWNVAEMSSSWLRRVGPNHAYLKLKVGASGDEPSLRFPKDRLQKFANKFGAPVFTHSLISKGVVVVEGYVQTDHHRVQFEGQCSENDRPSLSRIQRMIAESRVTKF